MNEQEIDLSSLEARWAELWPHTPFLDVDNTAAQGREVRMHSLPKSKRYPDEAQDWAQLLHRQLTLLGELVDSTPAQRERLLLVTRAYSGEPTWDPHGPWEQRGEWFDLLVPSTYVASAISDPDPDGTVWAHYFVQRTSLSDVRLISALTLRAEFDMGFPFVIPEDLSWEFVPYDGGVDILAPTVEFAERLESAHAAWLPFDGPDKDRIDDGTPLLLEWPEPASWGITFDRLDRASAERVVQLLDDYEWGVQIGARVIDPARTFVLELDREDAQLLRAALTGESERVLDSLADPIDEDDSLVTFEERRLHTASPEVARNVLARRFLEASYLNQFIDDYGYREPEEAVDGRLAPKYWDASHDYSGLNND